MLHFDTAVLAKYLGQPQPYIEAHQWLRPSRYLHFNFGHAEIDLVILGLVCFLTSLLIIAYIFYKRDRQFDQRNP